MDVRRRLAAWAYARPRVLLVAAPDRPDLRRLVESELERRHWTFALAPGEADVLLQVGGLDPDLAAAADVLWDQVPMPRARRTLHDGEQLRSTLDALPRELAERLRGDPDSGPGAGPAAPPADASPHDDGGGGADDDHGDRGGHDHDHDHGGDVAGLPMAGTEPDRDGLELDVLQVHLGPVLPGWPTGLTIRGRLQGDVLTGVEVHACSQTSAVVADPFSCDEVDALDVLAGVLLVAGWTTASRHARLARSAVAARQPDSERLVRRVTTAARRSRALRWSLRGLGVVPDAAPWPPGLRGDAWDRVLRWCDVAERAGARLGPSASSVVGPATWAGSIEGAELAGVRLVVASLAPGLTAGGERADLQAVSSHG